MRYCLRFLGATSVAILLLSVMGPADVLAKGFGGGMHIGGGMHFGGGHFGGGHFGGGHMGGGHIGHMGGGHFSAPSGSMGRNGGNVSGSQHFGGGSMNASRSSSFSHLHAFPAHGNLSRNGAGSSFMSNHAVGPATGTRQVGSVAGSGTGSAGGHHASSLIAQAGMHGSQGGKFLATHGGIAQMAAAHHAAATHATQMAAFGHQQTGAFHSGGFHNRGELNQLALGFNRSAILPRGYNWGWNLWRNLWFGYGSGYGYGFGYGSWAYWLNWGLNSLQYGLGNGYGYGGYGGYNGGYGSTCNYGSLPYCSTFGYADNMWPGANWPDANWPDANWPDMSNPGTAVAFADPLGNAPPANGPLANGAAPGQVPANNARPATRDADNAKVFAEKGETEFKARDYKTAVYDWKHALTDDPNNGVLLMMISQGFFATGQYDEAAGAAQRAMRLLPPEEWGVVVKNFRELYGNAQDFTVQLRALEAAIRDKPQDPAMRFLVGFQYAYLGYSKEAIDQLDKGLQNSPRDEMARKLRAEMAVKLPKGQAGTKP